MTRVIVILDLRKSGTERLAKGIVELSRKRDPVWLLEWTGVERVLFEDDMALKLCGLAIKCHRGGNTIRRKGPEGKCVWYVWVIGSPIVVSILALNNYGTRNGEETFFWPHCIM